MSELILNVETQSTSSGDLYDRARIIAEQYRVIVEPQSSGQGFIARGVELPLVLADGKTVKECFEQLRHQMTLAVAVILKAGTEPPRPAKEQFLDQQINVRVMSEEKALAELRAKQLGFRGISDFVRSLILKAL